MENNENNENNANNEKMTIWELKKLSRAITYYLDMNGGCVDEDIQEMMDLYKAQMKLRGK